MKLSNQSPIGTSYHDTEFNSSVNRVREILGEPQFQENSGTDKVNFEWTAETKEGDVFTIYDYKEYRVLNEDENITFHIGGQSRAITQRALAELNIAYIRK